MATNKCLTVDEENNTWVYSQYVRLGYDGRKRCRATGRRPICYGTVRCLADLNPVEQAIQLACPTRMTNGTETEVKIEYFMGFELFGRGIPYHNYENWSGGFEVVGKGFRTTAEYLDTAVYNWARAVIKATGDQRRIDKFEEFMKPPVGLKGSWIR